MVSVPPGFWVHRGDERDDEAQDDQAEQEA